MHSNRSKEVIPNPKEQVILRRIAAMRHQGMAFLRISDKLNSEGIPAKRGGKWYPATVSYLVKNVIPKLSLA